LHPVRGGFAGFGDDFFEVNSKDRRKGSAGVTLYRDFPASQPTAHSLQPSSSNLPFFQDRLLLRVVNH
jgi:hypothetical protein